MKALVKIIAASLLSLCLSSAHAATGNLKIGVIDVRDIVATSSKAQSIADDLKKEFEAREQKIMAMDKSFQDKAEKFKRDSAVMGEKERAQMERELHNVQRDIQRMQAEYREDSSMRQREEMQKFLDNVKKVVNQVAEKEHFDLIIHSDAVPFMNDKVDITKQVMAALDK